MGERKKLVLTVKECATVYGTGTDAIYKGIQTGEIPHIKVGDKLIRVPVTVVEQQLILDPGEVDRILSPRSPEGR